MCGSRIAFALVLLFMTVQIHAKECSDTLLSAGGDKAVIRYDIKVSGDIISVRFLNTDMNLEAGSRKSVRKKPEVGLFLFDRTGSYKDVSFTGLTPSSVMIPAELGYEPSKKGYFNLDESPRLDFQILDKGVRTISFPVYLVCGDGGRRYEIIGRFDDLRISMPLELEKTAVSATVSTIVEKVSLADIDEEDEGTIKIVSSIKTIQSLLDMQEHLPFSETLQYEITRLRMLQDDTNDRKLLSKIREVLIMCEQKRSELAAKADAAAQKERMETEMQQRKAEAEAKAQQDSLAVAEQKAAEKSRKQKTWMILGGIVLAVFGYAGNQVLQHFRNISNQRSIMEMQESIARQAESKARGQARRYVNNQIREIGKKPKNKTSRGKYSI